MTISGFTFARNSHKYYFPVKESILSILPLVDEFIVALGDCDRDDATRQEILSINSSKIKIIDTVWDTDSYPRNTVYAQQTDIAKGTCSGDWLLYLQNDEVIHEADLDLISEKCKHYLSNDSIEGLVFEYLHFWGDYDHYHQAHNWYPREIRMVKNISGIHSWKDAQSFRYFESFRGKFDDYQSRRNTRKLQVARIGARIFHYGWVRPPEIMAAKALVGNPFLAQKNFGGGRRELPAIFDYGPLDRLSTYRDSHPEVMNDKIASMDWSKSLQYGGSRSNNRPLYKHERLKYRFLSWVEYEFLGGRQIGGFRNYKIVADDTTAKA